MSTKVVQKSEGNDTAWQQSLKSKMPSGLLRKLTTKLKPPTVHQRSANSAIISPPNSPPTKRSAVPAASTDAAAIERRRAALQQCGLVPLQRKDLSQLEHELDQRFSQLVIPPQDQPEQGELSTAEKIRREWQAKNETQPQKQGHDLGPKVVPNDVGSGSLDPEPLGKSDLTSNAEQEKSITPAPPHVLLNPTNPISLSSIPATLLFPDIPEEDDPEPENEKSLPPIPSVKIFDPLVIPLPDSPFSSSADLSELPPSLRENKRPPPIAINTSTNDAKENAEDVNRGRSLNRSSVHSLMNKSSLPALSPTMTASSFSSLPTPRDEESMERIDVMITRSTSGKPRAPRFGKISDGRDSEDLDIVHEAITESPESTPTESRLWNPNRESADTMGSAGFGAFVERREKKKRTSTGIFPPSKRNSGSNSRKSTTSELSLGWSAIANDFSLKPLDVGRSRSSTLSSTPTSPDEKDQVTPTQSQTPVEQPQSKIARSKSVIASLGLKLSRKVALQPTIPSPPPSPVRLPTAKIVENRESLLRDVKGIEDDESRRLTELAFVDY